MALFGTAMGLWGAAWSSAALSGTVGFLTSTIGGRLLVSVASSALMAALQGKRAATKPAGLTSQYAQSGADNPLSFPLGTTATAGTRLAPWLSHGKSGSTPRAYATLAVAVSAVAGCALKRVAVNGEWIELGGEAHPDYGQPCLAVYDDYFWIKWLDGSQTEADPMMRDKYGADPDYPWSADMVGAGLCIAFVTFRYSPERYSGAPTVVFETSGIPLYDPRKDSTVGGDGPHRFDDSATWEPSDNPIVQGYNVCRGIELSTGDIWGGVFEAWRLPFANWAAAMSLCDIDLDGAPTYRAGYEVEVADQPSAVLKELLKACGGAVAECDGRLKVRVGGAGLPVLAVSDADFLINKDMTEVPFASPSKLWNGATATYPEPESVYASEDAPILTDATLEAEDGGQRNLASLQFPAVPYNGQVQRLQYSLVQDNRRQRRHAGSLQGAGVMLEPLDAIAWTSLKHGYDGKSFEIAEVTEELRACVVRVSLKEVDAADWAPPPEAVQPRAPVVPGITRPAALTVPDWTVTATKIYDASGIARRAAVTGSWSAADLDGVDGLQWQVKDSFEDIVVHGVVSDVSVERASTSENIIPKSSYWMRSRLIADVPTEWTAWFHVVAPDVQLSALDFDPSTDAYIQSLAAQTLTPLELENMNVIERRDLHPDWTGTISAEIGAAANLLAGGAMDDPADWIARSGSSSYLQPADLFVADVDGDGTPGLLKDADGYTWLYTAETISIDPAETYTISMDIARVGAAVGRDRFLFALPDALTTARAINLSIPEDDVWHSYSETVSGADILSGVGLPTTAPADLVVGFELDSKSPATASGAVTRARDLILTSTGDQAVQTGITDGSLKITVGAAVTGILYEEPTVHDLGAVFQSRVAAVFAPEIWNTSYTWDSWGMWDNVENWAGATPDSSAVAEYSATSDDPADPSAYWTEWSAPSADLVTARAYKFRIRATFGSPGHALRLPYATFVIDVPDRTITDRDVACPAAGIDYAFDPPFMDTPAVVVTPYGLAAGSRIERSAVTAEGVSLRFFDATDTAVAGTFDIIAKGYGRKETT